MLKHLAVVLTLAAPAQPALALNILLSNDDGLTSNVKALYDVLKADGHDVIVSVPCTGQSGRGAALVMYSPQTIVADNDKTQVEAEGGCHNGAASIGAPAVGPFTKAGYTNGDFHYVHGTPVMATLYGLDVLAPARWKQAPDLVLSGPNEGQNLGRIINSSGTVGNAQFAAIRGLPAIALSAGTDTVDNVKLANPNSVVVARLTSKLVKALQVRAGKAALLPAGLALNVNFPNAPTLDAGFIASRIGSFEAYRPYFRNSPPYGLNYMVNTDAAATAEQSRDEAVVVRSAVSVSPMQIGFEAATDLHRAMVDRLGGLLRR